MLWSICGGDGGRPISCQLEDLEAEHAKCLSSIQNLNLASFMQMATINYLGGLELELEAPPSSSMPSSSSSSSSTAVAAAAKKKEEELGLSVASEEEDEEQQQAAAAQKQSQALLTAAAAGEAAATEALLREELAKTKTEVSGKNIPALY